MSTAYKLIGFRVCRIPILPMTMHHLMRNPLEMSGNVRKELLYSVISGEEFDL